MARSPREAAGSAAAGPLHRAAGRWIVGLLLGIVLGMALGLVPVIGLVLATVIAVWVGASRQRLAAASGSLIGTGGTYFLLLQRAVASCQSFRGAGSGTDCRPPADLAIYQGAAATVLVLGAVLLAASLLRAFASHAQSGGGTGQ